MLIAYAQNNDLVDAAHIVREAAEWLENSGQQMWTPSLFTENWAGTYMQRGELVVAKKADKIIGVALLQSEDKVYWPEAPKGAALYLHKLCVARNEAGHRVADAIIEWAAQQARKNGSSFLRLDCSPRHSLIDLYQRCGFAEVNRQAAKDDQGRDCETVRMQKPLGSAIPC